MNVQVYPKRISSEEFVWHIYCPSGGKMAEIDPRTGGVVAVSAGPLPEEMMALMGAMSEWSHTDARNFSGANRKKIQSLLNYRASY